MKMPVGVSGSSKKIAQNMAVGALSTKWGLAPITDTDEANCFAVAVRADDLPTTINCSTATGEVHAVDLLSGVFAAGSEVSIEVPAGPQRRIALIGFKTTDTSLCKDLGESGGVLPVAKFSPPVIIKTEVADLEPGDNTISIQMPNAPDGGLIEDCDTKPFGSETLVSASLSGYPTGRSAAASITVDVSGYNVESYLWSMVAGLVCPATLANTSLATSDISFSLSSLPDGPVTLCVKGITAGGLPQTDVTSVSWTKDVIPPGMATSLSVAARYSNDNTPTVTVNGAEVGDTVDVYSAAGCTTTLGSAVVGADGKAYVTTAVMPDADYTFRATITDQLGRTGSCSTTTIPYMVDTVPPSSMAGQLGDLTEGNSLHYTPLYKWNAVLDTGGSGISKYKVAVGHSTDLVAYSGSWVDAGLNFSYFFPGNLYIPDGTNAWFSVVAVDNAGNVGAAGSDAWTVDNSPNWGQQAYIKASNNTSFRKFGNSVDMDGDIMVAGAPGDDVNGTDSGAAYVFRRSGGVWSEEFILRASQPTTLDYFGESVAVYGDTIAVGANGEGSNVPGIIAGNESAVDTNLTIGAVYIYKYDGSNWNLEAYIKPPNANTTSGMHFGKSVALYKDTLVVGAPQEDNNQSEPTTTPPTTNTGNTASGAAYVYVRSGTTWTFHTYIKPVYPKNSGLFGYSVAIDGNKIVVGSNGEPSAGGYVSNGNGGDSGTGYADTGAAYVYANTAGAWAQQAVLRATYWEPGDKFGSSVDIFGDYIVVGSPNENFIRTYTENFPAVFAAPASGATSSGGAYVFITNGTNWYADAYLKPTNSEASDAFGTSVSIFNSTIVVGAPGEDSCDNTVMYGTSAGSDNTCSTTGAVYAFQRNVDNWDQAGYFKQANNSTTSATKYGSAVKAYDTSVVVGALEEKSTYSGIIGGGATSGAQTATQAGAVFVYDP